MAGCGLDEMAAKGEIAGSLRARVGGDLDGTSLGAVAAGSVGLGIGAAWGTGCQRLALGELE